MIGNNSCGPHSVMGGTTVENVLAHVPHLMTWLIVHVARVAHALQVPPHGKMKRQREAGNDYGELNGFHAGERASFVLRKRRNACVPKC